MYHKLVPVVVGLLAALGLAATAALAEVDHVPPVERGTVAPAFGASVNGTTPLTGQQKLAAVIAARFGVTPAEVQAIRQQNEGWGEVFKVFLLAKLSNKSAADIVTLRQSDKGWGEIYKTLGLRPGKGDNLGQALKPAVTPASKQGNPPGKNSDNPPGYSPGNLPGNGPGSPPGRSGGTGQENGRGQGHGKNKPNDD